MLNLLPDDDELYAALLARDPRWEGSAFAAVTSTGIFCRLTCPARKPKREHTVFFRSVAECMEAGFRPCLRCRPLHRAAEADAVVRALLDALEAQPGRRWREADIAAMGFDPSTVRRAFRRHFGITFLELARFGRLRSGAETLSAGARVIDAQLEAGFESGSGFRAAFARMLGRAPSALRGDAPLRAEALDTPLGPMVAVADRDALYLLGFFSGGSGMGSDLKRLERTTGAAVGVGRLPPIDSIQAELEAYFRGESADFRTPLAPQGSAFARRVWSELRRIPPGETRSYSDVATAIGRPQAVRAVARANATNPLAIVVPCHRVIGADGTLTGYGGGLWRKRRLIELERKLAHQASETGRNVHDAG